MFSIVIPYYKKRNYIERCLDAVLAQTCQNFEIILVDDGSQDDIAKLISQKYPQVKLIQQDNQGVSAARNTGIANAKHEYIAFLDADDYWSAYYLEKNAEVIHKIEYCTIIGSSYSNIIGDIQNSDEKTMFSIVKDYFKYAIRNTFFFTSATVIKTDFFRKNEGFCTSLKYGEDLDVWWRAVLSGGSVVKIENIMVYYSLEDENQATKKKAYLRDTISGNAFDRYQSYFSNNDFRLFISKYLYFNIYRAYYNHNHEHAKKVLKNIPEKFFFAEVYYSFPLFIGEKLIRFRKCQILARKYFKLLFRYIYT